MRTLFVGDTTIQLSIEAKKFNSTAVLIENHNLKDLDNIEVGYISLGDHCECDFIDVLDSALEIHYVPSISWLDDIRIKTESYLRYLSHRKIIYNIPPYQSETNMLHLEADRINNNSQIWVAGCSVSSGAAIANQERWGQLIADKLNLPVSFIARPGTSNVWSADQILRSNVRQNDIVLWGLTGINRITYYNHNSEFEYIVADDSDDKIISKKLITSDHLLYKTLISIDQVVKKSKDLGFTLLLVMFPFYTREQELILFSHLSQYNFCTLCYEPGKPQTFIDYGLDNIHPGPIQNQYYADKIFKTLDQLSK